MDGKRVNSASLANAPFWPHSIVNGFDQFLANLSAGRATGSRPYDNKDAKKQDCPHLFYTDVVNVIKRSTARPKAFLAQLPHSVAAFVYPLGSERSRFGAAFVRESHAQFLRRFNRSTVLACRHRFFAWISALKGVCCRPPHGPHGDAPIRSSTE